MQQTMSNVLEVATSKDFSKLPPVQFLDLISFFAKDYTLTSKDSIGKQAIPLHLA